MGKQIFRLQLDDQALPGFASGAKDYFGTLEMIEGFINAIRNDEQFNENYKNLISFFDRYKNGETDRLRPIQPRLGVGAPQERNIKRLRVYARLTTALSSQLLRVHLQ